MNDKMIPYAAIEACEAVYERRERRHVGIIILLIIALLAVIGMATYERLQYDTINTSDIESVEVDNQNGNASYIGNDNNGTVNNGKD